MSVTANNLVLEPGEPMRDRLERAAQQWVLAGRNVDSLLTGVAFLMAQCWLNSKGDETIQRAISGADTIEFVAASKAALGGDLGWNSMLSQKDFCRECHMTFRLENLGICTECAEYVCGACRGKHASCGGEIVG